VQRAYAAWQALEAETGARLLVPTGGLTIGPPDGRLVTGALDSAQRHGLAHEVLTAAEAMRRRPAVRLPAGAVAIAEPRAGVVLAARAIAACLDVARRHGAELRTGAAVEAWDAAADGVRVRAGGETIAAARLVLAAGPWMPTLVPELAPHLAIERNVVHWFTAKDAAAPGPDRLPVLVIEDAPDHLLYALPSMRALGADLEDGVKFARHHSGVTGTADTIDREPSTDDVGAIQSDARRYLPDVDPVPMRSAVCCYTNAADGHFIVDRHPAHDRVVVISACSGHGFKFASVLGGIAANMLDDVNVHGDLAPFTIGRYSPPRR